MSEETIIKNTILKMANCLDYSQLKALENILITEFKNEQAKEHEQIEVYDPTSNYKILLEAFKVNLSLEGKCDTTIKQYIYNTEKLLYSLNKDVKDITQNDIKYIIARYQTENKVSGETLNNFVRCCRPFFNYLYNEHIIPINPIKNIKSIKTEKKEKEAFTGIEIAEMRESCEDYREKAILEFLLSTGARVSEVVQLNISDLRSDNSCIVYGKGRKERVVYFSDNCSYYLKKYIEERKGNSEALFTSVRYPYNRLNKDSLERIVREIGKRADNSIKAHPHKFRRSLITHLLNSNCPLQEVSTIAGHVNTNTTMRYWHRNQQLIKMHHAQFGY